MVPEGEPWSLPLSVCYGCGMSEGTEFSLCPASDALWAGRSRGRPPQRLPWRPSAHRSHLP